MFASFLTIHHECPDPQYWLLALLSIPFLQLIRPADDETGIVNWTRKVAGVARSMGIVVVDKDTEVQTEVVESSLHQEDADDWIFK